MVSKLEENFQKGEIVWVKMKENSYWPGQIKKILKDNNSQNQKKLYQINLINQSSNANFPLSKIEKFEEKVEKVAKTKKQNLLNAIEKAKKMIEENKNSIVVESDFEENGFLNNSDSNLFSNFSTNEKNSERENESFVGKKSKRNLDKKLKKNKGINTINNCNNICSNPKNININININVTSSDNNTVINNFNSNQEIKKTEKENMNENFEEQINEEESLNEDKIKNYIDNLLKLQIEIPNSNVQNLMLNELNKLHQDFKLSNNNNNIYSLTKDIIPVLNSLLYNKYEDIVNKSSEIISDIIQKIIEEVFNLENKELNQLNEVLNNINIDDFHEDILLVLSQKRTKKKISKNLKKKNQKNLRKLSNLSFSKDNKNEIENKNFHFINEIFNKYLNEDNSKDLNILIKNFYENDYNKIHCFDIKYSIIRKHFCIKMLKVLKTILRNKSKEDIKKFLIFLEYKIRCEDSSFGKKYHKIIKILFNKVKEKIKQNK